MTNKKREYKYDCKVLKVVDGDTVDIDIDLGFGVWLHKERVRIMGIDTPESRTSNEVEKLFGLAAKEALKHLLPIGSMQVLTIAEYDAKGKFGRILGDFEVGDRSATEILIEQGHCVPYFGDSKDDVQAQHAINRQKLLAEGVVSQEDYDKAVAKMAK